jgi:hypothetical protein
MAEREGFEPSVVFSYARFPGVCLKPLSHLSATREPNVKYGQGPRNGFLNGWFERLRKFALEGQYRREPNGVWGNPGWADVFLALILLLLRTVVVFPLLGDEG